MKNDTPWERPLPPGDPRGHLIVAARSQTEQHETSSMRKSVTEITRMVPPPIELMISFRRLRKMFRRSVLSTFLLFPLSFCLHLKPTSSARHIERSGVESAPFDICTLDFGPY